MPQDEPLALGFSSTEVEAAVLAPESTSQDEPSRAGLSVAIRHHQQRGKSVSQDEPLAQGFSSPLPREAASGG